MSNELQLSQDLNVITAEINSYKQVAGQSIFEIGRRLKWVKENDLVHGQWGNWLKENVSFTDRQARRFIQAFDEFKTDDVFRIGTSKVFELLSFPDDIDKQEFINQQHTIPSTGEQKTVNDMTVKELREVKQALKQAEEDKKRLAQLLTEERNKPPMIETVHKEVIPDHVKKKINEYEKIKSEADKNKSQLDNLNRLLQKTVNEKNNIEQQLNEINSIKNKEQRELEELRLKEEKLKHEAHVSIFELQIKIQEFIKNASPSLFLQGAISYGDVMVRKELTESVKALEDFVEKLKDILQNDTKRNYKNTNNTIIDVEVI